LENSEKWRKKSINSCIPVDVLCYKPET